MGITLRFVVVTDQRPNGCDYRYVQLGDARDDTSVGGEDRVHPIRARSEFGMKLYFRRTDQ